MTPEATRFLEKARKLLEHADTMLGVELNDDAGRTAYLAGFHAAQALIFERTGKTPKTHKGVQMEFFRLTKNDSHVAPDLRIFLSQVCNRPIYSEQSCSQGTGYMHRGLAVGRTHESVAVMFTTWEQGHTRD